MIAPMYPMNRLGSMIMWQGQLFDSCHTRGAVRSKCWCPGRQSYADTVHNSFKMSSTIDSYSSTHRRWRTEQSDAFQLRTFDFVPHSSTPGAAIL